MLLYADENFDYPVVAELGRLGHDVITAQEHGLTATPDPVILARAHALGRVVLTHNRRHFERLDRQAADHSGILSATQDGDFPALAVRIDAALTGRSCGRWCIRVNCPGQAMTVERMVLIAMSSDRAVPGLPVVILDDLLKP